MLLLLVVALVVSSRRGKRRSDRLQQQYGDEYQYAVAKNGDRKVAERELESRRERVAQLELKPLDPDDAQRITQQWMRAQTHFVDAPSQAIREADGLVAEVMELRGYPTGDFERRAADISVDHADLVTNYRSAHQTALRNSRGNATTEEMRRAMVQYRDLFSELLETRVADEPAAAGSSRDRADENTPIRPSD